MSGQSRQLRQGDRTMMASRFKAECLGVLDQVERLKVSITITKHGRPIARVVPLDEDAPRPIDGSVHLVAEQDTAYYSTGERWDAESG